MFGSIRSRLVTSYVLLTLLAVMVVGVLSLLLLQRSLMRQEEAYLMENAEAIAAEATALLEQRRAAQLGHLARSAAFFTDAQVRILDTEDRVLADSGEPALTQQVIWFDLPPRFDPALFEIAPAGQIPVPWDEQMLAGEPLMVMAAVEAEGVPDWFVERGIRVHPDGAGFRLSIEEQKSDVAIAPMPEEAVRAGESPVRRVQVPIGDPARPSGYVEVTRAANYPGETLATTRQALGWAGGGALLFAALVGVVVSRHLTAPIHQLSLATGRISQGDFSARAPEGSPREIGQLAAQFNRMADHLEESFAALAAERDTLRRFIADASHELRTPVTALTTFNELLQGPASEDPPARQQFLEESAAQLERLTWITQNLLDLSRLDAGLAALEREEVDAREPLAAVAAAFRPVAQQRDIHLTVETPPAPLLVTVDRRRLELALSNMVDNALKYTPRGGSVWLTLSGDERALKFEVRDTGRGIPADELPRLFERFYRGREAREPGSGLGLSIVQSVAQAHGGTVYVDSSPGAGATFTLRLPAK